MHTLPVLGALAERHREDPLVILGVHSAKFAAEREAARIQEAVARYGVHHPVVVDQDMTIWKSYTVRAWPTLVFIRPDGTIAGALPGEPTLETLEEITSTIFEDARTKGALGAKAQIPRATPSEDLGALRFPGKVLALPRGGVAVSDTGHHRVIVSPAEGASAVVIGRGLPGLVDGPAAEARFQRPQGLALDGRILYVADTGNHALRAVDLETWDVTTLAGNGELGRSIPGDLIPARNVALRSPWDLLPVHGFLLIAMAGIHQIWAYVPEEEAITVFAGSGRESIEEGRLDEASFSQPTGLTGDGARVYVADSEASAVRTIDLEAARVRTLVGRGLFVFGDVDGPPEVARLQHPQDVSLGPHGLLVADTYNDCLKHVDTDTGYVTTWYRGEDEGSLSEPAGVCQLPNGRVVVADTNHHRLLAIEPGSRRGVSLPLDISRPQTDG